MTEESDLAEVGPWAEQKLAALARYLEYYTTVLKKQTWVQDGLLRRVRRWRNREP